MILPTLEELLEKENLDIAKRGIMYPYREGDYEALIKRALNIAEVLGNLQTHKPSLNHRITGKRINVKNQLEHIVKYGDSVNQRAQLVARIVEAEEYAEALFYNPADLLTESKS